MEERYLVYHLIGKHIEVNLNKRNLKKKKVSGLVENVWRDIFTKTVNFKINGRIHSFEEPDFIAFENDELTFFYGVGKEISDKELFDKVRDSSVTGNINEVISQTEPDRKTKTIFHIKDVKKRRKNGKIVIPH